MTLDELEIIWRALKDFAKSADLDEARRIVARDIKLKRMNPVKMEENNG